MSPAGRVLQGVFPGGAAHRLRLRHSHPQAHPQTHRNATLQARGADHAFELPQSFSLPRGGGQPIPEPVRQKMEGFFGADFSGVRVHQGTHATSIGALAFTLGSDLYFAPGQYDPHSPRGQQLLGHELAHVVQQRQGRVRNPFGGGVAVVQDPALEAEAERFGLLAAQQRGPSAPPAGQPATPGGRPAAEPAAQPKSDFRVIRQHAAQDRESFLLYRGGRRVGAADLQLAGGGAAKVYNLSVDPVHRGEGGGAALLRAVAEAGMTLGRSRITLDSEDRGTGRLTRWYESLGFRRVGTGERGLTSLEIPAGRLRR